MQQIVATLVAAAFAATVPITALAAGEKAAAERPGHDAHRAAAAATALSSGEVQQIDKSAGKITIKHGPLANLGMPAMTMVFRVKEPAMIGHVKVGDRIHFVAEKI